MRPVTALLLGVILPWLALPAAAQSVELSPDGDYFVLQFDEVNGERLDDFIDLAQKILQRPIKYVPSETGEQNTRIFIIGPQRVRVDDFYKYFQAVLKAYDFIVVDYGPEGSDFLSVQRLTGGGPRGGAAGSLKLQARVVQLEELEQYKDNPGTLITTSVPLKYIDARTANTTFTSFFDGQTETVRAVENSNSIVFTAFGTSLWGAYQLVQLIDVPPFKPQPMIRKRVLQHASVEEIESVVTDLLAAARGLRPGQVQATPQPGSAQINEIEPRIIAEPRSNAFLIAGGQEDVDRIETWIDVLDVEVPPRGNIHVYRLKNMRADDIVETIQRVLEEERQSAQAGRSGGGAAAGGVTATSGLEIQASVVSDPPSNSLIITASDRKYAEIVEIIRELDVRRPQVLIEAAIVETRKTLNESLNVGVSFGDLDDGAFVTNFGTPLDFPSGDDGSIGDVLSQGGTFALFSSNDFPIPLVIEALETDSDNKVLSRPSLLTNDNQEAFIQTQRETAYRTETVLQSGSQTFDFETVEAGILLRVSPTISAGNYLRLRVRIEVSNFQPPSSGLEGAPPDVIRREIETPVTLPDGHTVVLGGLVSRSSSEAEGRIPLLADLPGIGWMFESSDDTADDAYLYVFITPHIIDTDFALLDQISAARKYDYALLGGDVAGLAGSTDVAGTDADLRALGPDVYHIFDMPSATFPTTGELYVEPVPLPDPQPERDIPDSAPPPPAPAPQTAPPTPQTPPPSAPSFDEVFGSGGDPEDG